MASRKSSKGSTKGATRTAQAPVCFVISPIGAEGSDRYKKFKEVLDYLITPAVNNSGFNLRVVRADDIERSGSFIKDILASLLESYVVIADLTEQNPNVFYELGVRHSLSPRTILIAQSIDHIPSDLREYRTIVYDTTLQGAALFAKRLAKYLKQIFEEPHRPDNPVLDRLQSIIEERTLQLQNENVELKKQITNILKKGVPEAQADREEPVEKRVDRIFKILEAVREFVGVFEREVGDEEDNYQLPTNEGNFSLYVIWDEDKEYISEYLYICVDENISDLERVLADVRVLLKGCSQGQGVECQFIIATNSDLSGQKAKAKKAFDKMKMLLKASDRKLFSLEIWDKDGLLAKEKELGIKVDL